MRPTEFQKLLKMTSKIGFKLTFGLQCLTQFFSGIFPRSLKKQHQFQRELQGK